MDMQSNMSQTRTAALNRSLDGGHSLFNKSHMVMDATAGKMMLQQHANTMGSGLSFTGDKNISEMKHSPLIPGSTRVQKMS